MSGGVLILGAGGQVGRATAAVLRRQGRAVTGLTRGDLDITDESALDEVFRRVRPATVINAAAFTAVDRAEAQPWRAEAVNGLAPGLIGASARRHGAALIHLSTDYVFDGEKGAPYVEADTAAPVSVYGRSKLAGEAAVLRSGAAGVILRTSWLLSAGGFVGAILSRARSGEVLRVVDDQKGRPTLVDDLAQALAALARQTLPQAAEVYHYAGATDATWFELADALVDEWSGRTGAARPVITGVTAASWNAPARRPSDSRLDSGRIAADFGLRGRDWREGVPELVEAWLNKEPDQ